MPKLCVKKLFSSRNFNLSNTPALFWSISYSSSSVDDQASTNLIFPVRIPWASELIISLISFPETSSDLTRWWRSRAKTGRNEAIVILTEDDCACYISHERTWKEI